MATPGTASLNLAKMSMPARIGVGAVFVVLVALTYWVMFYTDVSSKIETAKSASSSLNADLATQQQAQASYFADRDELALRQQRQRELNKVLPAEAEQAAFLSAIQQVSNVSGIDLQGWTPMDEKSEAFFAKVPMRIDVTGKFHQIAKFTYEIGKLDRIINVENIALEQPKLEGADVVLKAHCLATTFHMLAPKPEGKK